MKVLLVEDDRLLGESLTEYLQSEGFITDWVYDPREVMDLLEVSRYDVIVLDLIMPHIGGEELIKAIREKDKETPILVLTAKQRLEDKRTCFELGADDYLTKPFEMEELVLRLKALYRRKNPQDVVVIDEVEVCFSKEMVKVKGKPISLSKKDWLVLKFLVENRGRFVSHEEILNYVWGDEPVGEDVVRAHIKNLRKLLPEGFIKTMKGRGYRVG
ncbi:response regulator transcription factor [Thermocrinis sp.]|jgi:Response regulators consisting of a CheY-like receiver domain and a winged-helix DNA-binding domain|uniref:response regulator transcription factor n=1 Tax=Thermocrinis sp. TaxID=2024383 RepID=UPI003C117DE0